jgi:hypothetical protein
MRRPFRTLAGVTAAAIVAIACSFTSSGAGGPGSEPDFYEGGLLPDGGIAQPNNGNTSSGSSSGSSNSGNPSNGTSNGTSNAVGGDD